MIKERQVEEMMNVRQNRKGLILLEDPKVSGELKEEFLYEEGNDADEI